MKNSHPDKRTPQNAQVTGRLKTTYFIILFGYALIPVITPNFHTLDSNGPKFLVLGIINLLSFIVFLADPDYLKRPELRYGFFRTLPGIAYSLFLLFSLLSFCNAINLAESVTYFARVLTVFGSAYVLFVIFSSDRNYIVSMAVVFSVILVFDSLTVFYQITQYISGDITSISDITSVYSNKNVLASALFVKVPAAMWLMFFTSGWLKRLGYVAIFLAMFATFIMSTRSFYLGLPGLLLAVTLFAGIRFLRARERSNLRVLLHIAGLFLVALALYSLVQQYTFPRGKDPGLNKGVVSRLSSAVEYHSADERFDSWRRSFKLIGEHPLLGVGTGNWKIQVLKYENQELQDFTYMYKNHNDFIEVTAETGLAGGLAYLAIFLTILFGFIRVALSSATQGDRLKLLFLPAFGILAYSVDAFFNFPANRPEIQALFAFYVAAGAAFSTAAVNTTAKERGRISLRVGLKKLHISKIITVLVVMVLTGSCWVLFLGSKSLHYQRLVKEDLVKNQYTHKASFLIAGYPSIPNLNCVGGPIAIDKARYLMNEDRNREAIYILRADSSSPFDARKEYYLAMNYIRLGIKDSALMMLEKVHQIKPLFPRGVILLSSLLFEEGQQDEAMEIADRFILKVKTERDAWLLAADQHTNADQLETALVFLDSALIYFPEDTVLIKKRIDLKRLVKIAPHKALYDQARASFNTKQYTEALNLLNDLLSSAPDLTDLYPARAWCRFFTGDYAASIEDINIAIEKGTSNDDLLNLRGEGYLRLGQVESACRDFKAAMEKGHSGGEDNYRKYCRK